MKNVSIIVAHDYNRVIGNKGQIPWHIPADLQRFKKLTEGHVVIMGRKTWESLPTKPLPDRINLVLSHSMEDKERLQYQTPYGESLYSVVLMCQHLYPDKSIFIIGGQHVYEQALELDIVDKIYCTLIDGIHPGDTVFPILPLNQVWDTKKIGTIEFNDPHQYGTIYGRCRWLELTRVRINGANV